MPLKISQNSHENIKIPGQSVGGPGKRRSSHWRCSVKKGVLKNLANFEGKNLCWSLFLIKLQQIKSATLLKLDSNTDVFL